jgi:hypothetical protein
MIGEDKAALERALVIVRSLDARIVNAVETLLKTSTWQEAAEYAVFHVQTSRLHLRPWMCPPCWANDEIDATQPSRYGNKPNEVELRQRLRRAGLSVFEPNPLEAIAQAEAKSA